MRTSGTAATVLLLAGLASTACGGPSDCRGFAVTIALDGGGQADPVAAATWFAVHGEVDASLPHDGWRADVGEATGTTVRSGDAALHTVRLEDGTWAVDSGTRCG